MQGPSVDLSTLKPGQVFTQDCVDAVARLVNHRVSEQQNPVIPGSVRVDLFCDRSVTSSMYSTTKVFPKEMSQ